MKKHRKLLISITSLTVLFAVGFAGLKIASNVLTYKKDPGDGVRTIGNWGTPENWERSKLNKTVISTQEKGVTSNSTTINFTLCDRGIDTFGFGFGSTTFNFLGIESGRCHFYMGTEVENPMWDGYLDKECYVPTDYETEYRTSNTGANLTFVADYCE